MSEGFVPREVGDLAALEEWLAGRGNPGGLSLVMSTEVASAVITALFAHGYTTASVTEDSNGFDSLVVVAGRDTFASVAASRRRKEE